MSSTSLCTRASLDLTGTAGVPPALSAQREQPLTQKKPTALLARFALSEITLLGKVLSLALLVLVAVPAISQAQTAGVNDGHGKEWMQLPATVGLSWNATAQACPQDGVNACVGSIAGRNVNEWVWATDS